MTDFLTREKIARFYPAVYAEGHNNSDRYKKVNTGQVIEFLGAKGYGVTSVSSVVSRGPTQFGNHLVRLRHIDARTESGTAPEIIILNSHNGSKAFTIASGLFRFVCANGMISGEDINTFRIKHIGNDMLKEVASAVKEVTALSLLSTEVIRKMQSVQLETQPFLDSVRELLDVDKDDYTKGLLSVRRVEDQGNSAWAMFNRVQENWSKGRWAKGKTVEEMRKVPQPRDVNKIFNINRGLWNIAVKQMENA